MGVRLGIHKNRVLLSFIWFLLTRDWLELGSSFSVENFYCKKKPTTWRDDFSTENRCASNGRRKQSRHLADTAPRRCRNPSLTAEKLHKPRMAWEISSAAVTTKSAYASFCRG